MFSISIGVICVCKFIVGWPVSKIYLTNLIFDTSTTIVRQVTH